MARIMCIRWNLMVFGLTILMIVMGTFTLSESADTPANRKLELRFLNWADYMDPEIVREFENKYGATVRQIYFETEDLRTDMLLRSSGKGYDLVVCNDIGIRAYVRRGWIEPLTKSDVPNLKHIGRRWIEVAPEAVGYAVPYAWGTTGIGYRRDLVGEPVKSWSQLFIPTESLRGKILMVSDSRDVIGMALKALGYSANSTNERELAEAEQLLLKQKPYVRNYAYLSMGQESVLVKGDVWMVMMYSGDALMLKEHNPEIMYVVPREGGNIWVDYIAILRSSANKDLARQFINFINEPQIAARLAQFVYYATPNQAAEKLLPKEFLENPIIYPPEEVIEKSEIYEPLSVEAVKARNRIYFRVVAQ